MSNKVNSATDVEVFKARLIEYKELIDKDIKAYCKQVEASTLQEYGASARLVADAYLDILKRGGGDIKAPADNGTYKITVNFQLGLFSVVKQ